MNGAATSILVVVQLTEKDGREDDDYFISADERAPIDFRKRSVVEHDRRIGVDAFEGHVASQTHAPGARIGIRICGFNGTSTFACARTTRL